MGLDIKKDANAAVLEVIEKARLKEGSILVIGCSTSEVVGEHIGKASSLEIAKELFDAIYPELESRGIFIAAQCCEHLNRAIITSKECADKYLLEQVNVRPRIKAGGSFATVVYESINSPVAVEHIRADAGIDIGNTLIGMHLKEVAVPLRLSINKIGEANIVCARTRLKFIGGERADYVDELK